jgi:hypothetical protein
MRNLILVLALGLTVPSGVWAAPSKGETFHYSAEAWLVEDKTIIGAKLGGHGSLVGLDLAMAFLFVKDREGDGLDGGFAGLVFSPHIFVKALQIKGVELRAGAGLDAYGLFPINLEEWKFAMPVFVEARLWVTPDYGVYVQPRFYVLASDGLEPGVAHDGSESLPIFLVVGIGGRR